MRSDKITKCIFTTTTFIYTRRLLWRRLVGWIILIGLTYLLLPKGWLQWLVIMIIFIILLSGIIILIKTQQYAYKIIITEGGIEFWLQSGQCLFVSWDDIIEINIVQNPKILKLLQKLLCKSKKNYLDRLLRSEIQKLYHPIPFPSLMMSVTEWRAVYQCIYRIFCGIRIEVYIRNRTRPIFIDSAIDDINFFTILRERIPQISNYC